MRLGFIVRNFTPVSKLELSDSGSPVPQAQISEWDLSVNQQATGNPVVILEGKLEMVVERGDAALDPPTPLLGDDQLTG